MKNMSAKNCLGSTCLLIAAFALVATAVPASAELYTIELTNGKVFETRYQPQRADFDAGTIMVLTDVGNWIALPESMITDVTTATEVQGFGKVISTTTIELGFAPNDAADPSAEGGGGGDPLLDAIRELGNRGSEPAPYSVQQFAEPGQSTGLPANLIGSGLGTPISSEPIEPN